MTVAVFSTSCASKRPVMRVSPTVSAPRIRARCEMDLSPGMAAVPRNGPDRRDFKGLTVSEPRIFEPKSLFDSPLQAWQTTRLPTQPFFMGSMSLVKADLGLKRVCPSCGSRFYDLQKRPIECPKCAFSFEPESLYKQRRPRQPEPVAPVVERERDEDEETEEEVEEAEAEEAEAQIEEPVLVVAGDDEDEEEIVSEEAEAEGAGMSVVEPNAEVADIEEVEDEDLVEED